MTLRTNQPTIHDALVDVSMIDAQSCAAAASISISSWHAEVREGTAPQPAVRLPRMTRWRLADVRDWLIQRAARDHDQSVVEKATRASAKAQAARRAVQRAGS